MTALTVGDEMVMSGRWCRSLHRWSALPCPGGLGYHHAVTMIDDTSAGQQRAERVAGDDPGWPARCDMCGYRFGPGDRRQARRHHVWTLQPAGRSAILVEVPAGSWLRAGSGRIVLGEIGPTGRPIAVLPAGER